MIEEFHYTILMEGLKVLIMAGLPIVVVLALAGTLVSALQSATGISDPALGFGVRILSLVLVLYFMLPSVLRSLMTLTEMIYR